MLIEKILAVSSVHREGRGVFMEYYCFVTLAYLVILKLSNTIYKWYWVIMLVLGQNPETGFICAIHVTLNRFQ